MSYATDFLEGYIKPLNIKTFKHFDIILHSGTGCPYSVLVDIKRLLKAENKHLEEKKINNKGLKEFTIVEDEIK